MKSTTILYEINPEEFVEMIMSQVRLEFEKFKNNIESPEKTEFLSRQETATYLKVSLFCVHDWVKKGILKPYKMGNKTYFDRKEIEKKMFSTNL